MILYQNSSILSSIIDNVKPMCYNKYIQRFPPEIRQDFAKAPFLNGGLFTQNELDIEYSFNVKDIIFEMLFDYFDGEEPGFLEKLAT